jgi:DNA-binding response OmpR family regulator
MESGDEERQRDGSGQGRRSRGRFALDEKRCRVYKDERPLELTATEYSLLRFLFEHPEQVFTRTQLHDQCWEQTYYDDNTVAVYVRRLRAKIEETPDRPVHLRTMRGLGYFFSPGDSPGDSKDPEDEGSPRDGEGHGP